ncbi:hypothetical protein F5B20DRAFT_115734 [Whalleya microplaca]|nr:hypothetical protein F5B20DRAFT_115734 [Whalleya microplaca]
MADKPTSPSALYANTNFGTQIPTNSHSFPQSTHHHNKPSIAPSTSSMESEPKKPLDISNLMSPPEPPRFESFSQGHASRAMGPMISDIRQPMGPHPPLSPPISPATKTDDRHVSVATSIRTPVRDPILYPAQDVTNTPPQQPLFVPDDNLDTRRIVDDHMVSRPRELFREATPPRREDYELMLFFKSQVMKNYKKNPGSWLRRERSLLLADRRAAAKNSQQKLQPLLPAKPSQVRKETQRAKPQKPAKVTKTAKVTKPAQSQAPAGPRPIRSYPSPGPKQTPNRGPSATPDPAPRRAVAPNREDKDFESLPDFCPPTDSLPSKANSLKVDWKGTPIDLGNDPHRHLLHPDEVALAANLRLDCATYLTSKRRMFSRRLECLRMGKEFRKTDAQQACKIDVNKASKLWTAFDKVGWLSKGWMNNFL